MESTDLDDVPVFEIRTYDFNIQGISEYIKLMPQGLWTARQSFSTVMGPWKTELGGLCQVVYIAQYDSMKQLLQTRNRMLGDTHWNQFVMRMAPLQMALSNVLTVQVPNSLINTTFEPSHTAVYELLTLPESQNEREDDSRETDHLEGTTVVGRFLSVYGPSKTEFCLLRYPDSKTAFTNAFRRRPDLPPGTVSKLMVPLDVSKMK